MRPIDADALIEKCGDWYVEEGTESGFIGTLKNLLATEPTIHPVATDINDGDSISRQMALDCVTYDVEYTTEHIKALPSAQLDIKQAAKLLSDFIESCSGGDSYLITPDGEELRTDWGYAMEGIQLIHDWAERRTDGDGRD